MREFTLDEEVLCGYTVTKEKKQLWQVQLDLLTKFDEICKQNHILYFVGGGTMLGAVRHQGFIPWDDDVDVFIPYDEYLKLFSAMEGVKEPYHFQTYKNTKSCGPTMARFRRSDTTGCTKGEYINAIPPHNLGVFIDIFPLFYVSENKVFRSFQYFALKLFDAGNTGYKRLLKLKHENTKNKEYFFSPYIWVWRLQSIVMNHETLSKIFLKICTWGGKKQKKIGMTSFLLNKEKYIWNFKDFESEVRVPFENIMVPVPVGYDSILTHQYGNYHEFVMGGALHTMDYLNPNVPYVEFLQASDKSSFIPK